MLLVKCSDLPDWHALTQGLGEHKAVAGVVERVYTHQDSMPAVVAKGYLAEYHIGRSVLVHDPAVYCPVPDCTAVDQAVPILHMSLVPARADSDDRMVHSSMVGGLWDSNSGRGLQDFAEGSNCFGRSGLMLV